MHDQADELRQLVLRTAASARIPAAPPPPLVVVSGGKGGVGASTVAVNLTVMLARLGRRSVLVDADLNQPDATALCNVVESDTVADVLSGRRTVHEVLQPGPAGIQILPGAWAPHKRTECAPAAQQRMLAELSRLGAHTDVIVLDAGSKVDVVAERYWRSANLVVLVTTGDASAIMDSYAAIKLLAPRETLPPRIATLVNKADGDAGDVHARIGQASQRFLKLNLHALGQLPHDDEVVLAERARRPFVLQRSGCFAARAMESVAEQVLSLLGTRSASTSAGAGAGQVGAA